MLCSKRNASLLDNRFFVAGLRPLRPFSQTAKPPHRMAGSEKDSQHNPQDGAAASHLRRFDSRWINGAGAHPVQVVVRQDPCDDSQRQTHDHPHAAADRQSAGRQANVAEQGQDSAAMGFRIAPDNVLSSIQPIPARFRLELHAASGAGEGLPGDRGVASRAMGPANVVAGPSPRRSRERSGVRSISGRWWRFGASEERGLAALAAHLLAQHGLGHLHLVAAYRTSHQFRHNPLSLPHPPRLGKFTVRDDERKGSRIGFVSFAGGGPHLATLRRSVIGPRGLKHTSSKCG
jgi:hypothetical protein